MRTITLTLIVPTAYRPDRRVPPIAQAYFTLKGELWNPVGRGKKLIASAVLVC